MKKYCQLYVGITAYKVFYFVIKIFIRYIGITTYQREIL